MAIDNEELNDEKNLRSLHEDDMALLKAYGLGPYSPSIKKLEKEIMAKKVNALCGIKESDTCLAAPSRWDLVSDNEELKDEKNPHRDEDDIALLKLYNLGPYSTGIKKVEKEIKDMTKKMNDLCGIESIPRA